MIFDTTVIVDLLRDKEYVKRVLEEIGDEKISITSLTAYELLRGAFKKYLITGSQKELRTVINIISRSIIYDFDLESAKISSRIYATLRKEGKLVNEVDILIAGIVISNNEELITRDKDFLVISKFFPELIVTLI